ncbi:MAG TPA: glycosyltransferase family 4 protein [Terracidiphilus sp.]|nr:glycosyltransferase family 4 protein [Terracidiphilus sp.]
MADSVAGPFPFVRSFREQPTVLLGVTTQELCLILGARLRVLRRAGFRVVLVSGPGDLVEGTAARAGVESIVLPMHRSIAPLADLAALFRLWQILGRYKPDLVEFSTPKAGLLGMLAAWLRGVPRRIYMLRGLKLERSHGFKRWILLTAERMACLCAHRVLCNSKSLRTEALALRLAPASRLLVLGEGSSNGVDVDRFSPGPSAVRDQFSIPRDALVLGFVGRLTRDKGLPELAEAFDRILEAEPAAHLLLVGWFDQAEDALEAGLRQRILTHSRIHCSGFVSDCAPYYRGMDVMVLPTWREGFPNAILEASASGIPVVTTLSTGARDAVVREVTGLLIPPGYPEAIVDSVLKLFRDPERRFYMGRAARAWVSEHYSEDRVLGLTANYYRGLMEPRSIQYLQQA